MLFHIIYNCVFLGSMTCADVGLEQSYVNTKEFDIQPVFRKIEEDLEFFSMGCLTLQARCIERKLNPSLKETKIDCFIVNCSEERADICKSQPVLILKL